MSVATPSGLVVAMVEGQRVCRGLSEQQERFASLIARGLSNSAACRAVGINRRTGTRWRYGRSIHNVAGEVVDYAPVCIAQRQRPRHPRYLSLTERTLIADLRREGMSLRQIAVEIDRSPATVSRELRRNAGEAGRYLPAVADRLAAERAEPAPRPRRVCVDDDLAVAVNEMLGRRWAPEQVAHELRQRFPDQPERHLCTETIYQAIYDPQSPVTRPARRRRRRRRRATVQGAARQGRIPNMTMIDERPAEVEDRVEVGHWEGDCIIGAHGRSAIGTLVERRTRYLILVHVPSDRPRAEAIRDGISVALDSLPPALRRTLTWDQGKELVLHQQITEHTGARVFFCDAHSPWQRGSNENMNGLLRDYFPKGTDLSAITPAELRRVAHEINHRPRKTLNWARPADLLVAEIQADIA